MISVGHCSLAAFFILSLKYNSKQRYESDQSEWKQGICQESSVQCKYSHWKAVGGIEVKNSGGIVGSDIGVCVS